MPKKSRRRRRSQSEILVSVIKAMSTSKKKDYSIQDISRKAKTTWRTSKSNLDSLRKAGVVKVVREKGTRRKRYRLK